MNLNEYQEAAASTALYPGRGIFHGFAYLTSKLAGEAGEVAEKFGKAIRDDGYCYSTDLRPERKEAMAKELGDVLWYVSNLARDLGYSLEDIARMNLEKLFDRKERGVLTGDGDNR
jgi:NTP pyrophosphatase (non-canonical NTP hydrolase)